MSPTSEFMAEVSLVHSTIVFVLGSAAAPPFSSRQYDSLQVGTARAEAARQGRSRGPHCVRLLEHIGARVCRGRAAHRRQLRGCARAFCVVLLVDGLMAKHHLTCARCRRRMRARCSDARPRRRACMPVLVPGEAWLWCFVLVLVLWCFGALYSWRPRKF